MSHWNYRVVRRVLDGEVVLGIHEAYYDRSGDLPTRITNVPVAVMGDDLKWTLDRMLDALQQPILDYDQVGPGNISPGRGLEAFSSSAAAGGNDSPSSQRIERTSDEMTPGEDPAIRSSISGFFKEFAQAARDGVRRAPRRYFAPLVGAILGAIEYSNAAWDDRPIGRQRAKTYARLLSALANKSVADPTYIRRIIDAVLRANGDQLEETTLQGHLLDDLRAFDCPEGTGGGQEDDEEYRASMTVGRRFASRYPRTMKDLGVNKSSGGNDVRKERE